MKKVLGIVLILLVAFGCKAMTDTSGFTAKQHYEFAKSFFDDEDYLEAIGQFKNIMVQYPGNEVTDDTQFYLGQSHFERGEYILAAYEFSKLIKNMPASEYVPESQYMLANSYYELSPDAALDQTYSKKCMEEFQAFIEFFPLDKRVAEAENKIKELNEKLAEKEYQNALIYEKMEYYKASIQTHEYIVKIHHDSKYAKLSLYQLVQLYIRKDRVLDALRSIDTYLENYPEDEFAAELEKLRDSLQNEE